MKVKEESEKNWLKTQHSKNKDHGIESHNFMANRYGNNGNSDRFHFLGLQNQSKSSKDITLPTKDRIGKAMVFPVVMYGYESWTIKQAEH